MIGQDEPLMGIGYMLIITMVITMIMLIIKINRVMILTTDLIRET